MKRLLIVTQKVDYQDENLGFFHRWLEEFAKYNDMLEVLAYSQGKVSLPSNVIIHTFGEGSRIRRLWRFWELFSRAYAKSDAVLFHMIPEFVVASSPFLLSLRKPATLWYVHKSVTLWLKCAERLVDFIATASELSFRLPSKKVIYTGHAIDTEFFKPASAAASFQGIRILVLGRISPVKDIETVLRACEILRGIFSRSWMVSIVGGPLMPRDEDYLSSLKKLVKEKGLEALVHFEGAHSFTEVPAIYKEHDIFISMSTTGSVDKSVLEAMSAGLTVITANEAFREILPPQYFLETRSPEFLAERIKILAGEPRPNLKLREIVIQSHSLEKTIGKITELLKGF